MRIIERFRAAGKAFRSGDWWESLVGRGVHYGDSGINVSESSAMNYSPVFACVALASETISTLPFSVYEKTKAGREERTDHPVYKILHDKANVSMSAQLFREIMQWNAEQRGIAIAKKIRGGYGKTIELDPINPDAISEYNRDLKTGKMFFKLTDGKILSQDEVFYFYGPGSNGVTPKSRISYGAEAMGLGMAAAKYGRRFFGEGTNIGGFLKLPEGKPLSTEAFERLKSQMDEKYKGIQKSHGVIVLEGGAEFQRVGLSNNDSQFLETRRFEVEEICRWFGMKPHMIGDLSHATFSNIEQQGIEAVTYCWRPRCVRWEQAVNTQLITEKNIYGEFNLDGLMRGDLKSQVEAWNSLIQAGVLNADEVRKWMNLNPQDNDQGKIYFMPLNMVDKANPPDTTTTQETTQEEAPPELPVDEKKSIPKPGEMRSEQRRAVDHRRVISDRYRPKLLSVARQLVEKDNALIRQKMAELNLEKFTAWLSADYVSEIAETVKADSAPVINAFAMALVPAIEEEVGKIDGDRYDKFTTAYIDKFSTRYGANTRKDLRPLLDEEEYQAAVEEKLSYYEENRAGVLQREEITRQRSAFTKIAYATAGIVKLRWVANGKSCPFCSMLDGKIVGIEESFAEAGSSLAPDGKAPLTFGSSVGHAPAHGGCDCDIVAEV